MAKSKKIVEKKVKVEKIKVTTEGLVTNVVIEQPSALNETEAVDNTAEKMPLELKAKSVTLPAAPSVKPKKEVVAKTEKVVKVVEEVKIKGNDHKPFNYEGRFKYE